MDAKRHYFLNLWTAFERAWEQEKQAEHRCTNLGMSGSVRDCVVAHKRLVACRDARVAAVGRLNRSASFINYKV